MGTGCFSLMAVACVVASTHALPPAVVLETDSLPTDQAGWVFAATGPHAGQTVNDLFTPGPDFLRCNSMGFSNTLSAGSAVARYAIDPVDLPDDGHVVVDIRAQLLEEFLRTNSYGFSFGVCVDSSCMSMGLGLNRVQFQDLSAINLSTVGFDTQDVVDYRLLVDLDTGSYEVWVNGEYLTEETGVFFGGGFFNYFFIGDTTGGANAHALIYHYRVATYGCSSADIAEPYGQLDLADIGAFVDDFFAMGANVDSQRPFGVLDLSDVSAFIDAFVPGCPG